MSVASEVARLASRVGAECKSLRTVTGALANLATADKTSLVAAINEVRATAGAGALWSTLTAATVHSQTAYATTGLSVPVAAGKKYRIRAAGHYQTAAAGTGAMLRIGGTATATRIRWSLVLWGITANAATVRAVAAVNSNVAPSTAVITAATDFPWSIEGLIVVNTAGTLTVDVMSEVSGSAVTIQPDSWLQLRELP